MGHGWGSHGVSLFRGFVPDGFVSVLPMVGACLFYPVVVGHELDPAIYGTAIGPRWNATRSAFVGMQDLTPIGAGTGSHDGPDNCSR